MKLLIKLVVFCAICSSFTSCATMINGTRQNVTVTSNPVGATVSDGVHMWTTPATISLRRKQKHLLTISKPGHLTQIVELHRAFSGVTAANIIIPFGIIGWGIDAITGAQWKLLPEAVNVNLQPLTAKEIEEQKKEKEKEQPNQELAVK